MSILIKDIDLPEVCGGAEITIYIGVAGQYGTGTSWRMQKHIPADKMVQIPTPHGRMIDADKFISDYGECGWIDDISFEDFNAITPTVIEAEE